MKKRGSVPSDAGITFMREQGDPLIRSFHRWIPVPAVARAPFGCFVCEKNHKYMKKREIIRYGD